MRKCRNSWVFWSAEGYPDKLEIPDKCLSYTIWKKSGVDVIIDRSEVLKNDDYYAVEHHAGYYHSGHIRINKVDEGGFAEVHVRFTIDVSK